jgi:5-methylthioadenosine/S-adenosylhomocysteine deaminase
LTVNADTILCINKEDKAKLSQVAILNEAVRCDIIAIKADMIIYAGILLCVDEDNTVMQNQAVIINQGLITDILDIEESKHRYTSDNVISAEKQIVMPGFINTHTHVAMSYFKGLADDLPLDDWLNKYIWPAEAKCLNPEFVYEAS